MNKKILIVDDAEDTVDMVDTLLTHDGFDTLKAHNGEEALKILQQEEDKPDLVVLDMFMPEMSGREVCERMYADNDLKNVKVIFFTAAAFKPEGMKMLKKMNVKDYIVKPFNTTDFLKRIHKVVD